MTNLHTPPQDVVRFFEHARQEARRYGPDPWIFVRELMQNARDAHASQIDFDIQAAHEHWLLTCRDDGQGMSMEHARRYLFVLYASSKENEEGQIGRFGVGFWSVLRFEPEALSVSSCDNADGHGWEIVLHESTGEARFTERHGLRRGTNITLLRRRSGETLAQMQAWLLDAARQNGRFLTQAAAGRTPLPVTVCGVSVSEAFTLPGSHRYFEAKGVRGVVALAESPGVELFYRGLRVRVASVLDDLVSRQVTPLRARVRFANLVDSVAVRVLLDCDKLDLVLSRADARETKELRKFIAIAHKEIQRLIDGQLNAFLLPSWRDQIVVGWYRLQQWLDDLSNPVRALLGALSGTLIALALYATVLRPIALTQQAPAAPAEDDSPRQTEVISGPNLQSSADSDSSLRAFANYQGPSVDELSPFRTPAPSIRYTPASDQPLFLRVRTVLNPEDARPAPRRPPRQVHSPDELCDASADCYTIRLALPARQQDETYYLPTPSGYVASHLRDVSGQPTELVVNELGENSLMIAAGPATLLTYDAFPAASQALQHESQRHIFPKSVLDELRSLLRNRRGNQQVAAALRWVQRKVKYSTSSQTAQAHQAAILAGEDFVSRALAIGEGDCDVQNGLLTLVLQEFGHDARLAIGYVGRSGRVAALAHAWVEVHTGKGRLEVLDATAATLGMFDLPAAAGQQVAVDGMPSTSSAQPNGFGPSGIGEGLGNGEDESLSRSPSEASARNPPNEDLAWLSDAEVSSWVWGLAAACTTWLLLAQAQRERARRRQRSLNVVHAPTQLLVAALRQGPHALRNHALLRRQLLDQHHRSGLISLQEAQRLARASRLFVCTNACGFSRALTRRGAVVLDGRAPLVLGVANLLGAQQLDELTASIERSGNDRLVLRAREVLAQAATNIWLALAEPQCRLEETTWRTKFMTPQSFVSGDVAVFTWHPDDPRLAAAHRIAQRDFAAGVWHLVREVGRCADVPAPLAYLATRTITSEEPTR